jgi:hypothetical protein
MQVRTQLVVVAVIAVGWAAGNATVVRPVMAESPRMDRMSLAGLESLVAREADNVPAARALAVRYLELGMPRLVVDTMGRMSDAVQRDGRVALAVARAYERLGDVQSAAARITGALNRCTTTPAELAESAGCNVHTQTELAIESAALDRMIQWQVTPVSDPDRAALAHDLATRPIRMVTVH